MGAPVPVRIRGVVYPSIAAAAAAVGVDPSTISKSLARQGDADGCGLGANAPRRKYRGTATYQRPVTIHGVSWPSVTAAAADLGMTRDAMSKRLHRPMTPAISDDLLGRVMRWQAQQRKAA